MSAITVLLFGVRREAFKHQGSAPPETAKRGHGQLGVDVRMGTEPTAAARCRGYWPRLSRTRVEAAGMWSSRSLRARSRLDLEARKWRTVCCFGVKGRGG